MNNKIDNDMIVSCVLTKDEILEKINYTRDKLSALFDKFGCNVIDTLTVHHDGLVSIFLLERIEDEIKKRPSEYMNCVMLRKESNGWRYVIGSADIFNICDHSNMD